MAMTLGGVAGDALAAWRRDRPLLLALAGPFLFLPLFAWLLLADVPVPPADADRDARVQLLLAFVTANLPWITLRILVELFGAAAVLTLLLSRAHRNAGEVLTLALAMLPAFAAAVLLSWIAIGLGGFAFVIPGLYVYGRLALTGPALAADPSLGITGALSRSVTLTRGHGWQVFGYLALTLVAGLVVAQLMGGLEDAMTRSGAANPVARAVLAALSAGGVAASTLARLLMEAAIFRRLALARR